MERGVGSTIRIIPLLFFGLLYLIKGVHLHKCPTYEKHEALLRMLLTDKAICRAAKFNLFDKICLNGLPPKGLYCTNGPCNIFGYNCDKPCFTGDDNIDQDKNHFFNCSDTIVNNERIGLCKLYRNQDDSYREFIQMLTVNPTGLPGLPLSIYLWLQHTFYTLDKMNDACKGISESV